jgi:hypothetical protein
MGETEEIACVEPILAVGKLGDAPTGDSRVGLTLGKVALIQNRGLHRAPIGDGKLDGSD